jgi:hypothetical protein
MPTEWSIYNSWTVLMGRQNRYLVIDGLNKISKYVYRLHIWQANDNAYIHFEIRKKSELQVKVLEYGVY